MALTRLRLSWADVHAIPIRVLLVLLNTDKDLRREGASAAVKTAKQSKGVRAVVDLGRFV